MKPLSKIFSLNTPKETPKEEQTGSTIQDPILTYYQKGYGDAKGASGKSVTLVACLDNVYQTFKEKCRCDLLGQEKLRAPYKAEQLKIQTEIDKRKTAKDIKLEQKLSIETQIQDIDKDVDNVRVDPGKFGIEADKRPRAQFYIGLIVLLPITIYLLVFYISASYSAFFKTFENTKLTAAIFDAKAIEKAFNDGAMEAIFVCTIPFAFMGLGYLIHMFNKEKRKGIFKIILLLLVTFIFDGILAYLIEKKIYDFEKTLQSPEFNLAIAVTMIEFWGIIFAGFVIYIIWGLVFDFVMKEWENLDKIKLFIRVLKANKMKLNENKANIDSLIHSIDEEIAQLAGKLKELQSKIDGFIFPAKKYKLYHSEYVKGWFMAIEKELAMPHKEKEILLMDCSTISTEHLKQKDVYEENSELTIFASVG